MITLVTSRTRTFIFGLTVPGPKENLQAPGTQLALPGLSEVTLGWVAEFDRKWLLALPALLSALQVIAHSLLPASVTLPILELPPSRDIILSPESHLDLLDVLLTCLLQASSLLTLLLTQLQTKRFPRANVPTRVVVPGMFA